MLSAELLQLLHALEHGAAPSAVQVTLFSDLSREDVAELRGLWPRITHELREEIIVRAEALAEDNVDLDFRGLVLVALADEHAPVRRKAVEAAWESRNRETARVLRTLLSDDPDEPVRAAAATALEPYVLAVELEEFDSAEGERVIDALRAAWEKPGESVDVRARALESLGARSVAWVQSMVTDAYYSDDPRLRIAAVRAMGQSSDESWLDYLEETATSEDPELRYETAAALGVIGSEAGVAILADLLADEDTEVVNAAITGLGQVGGEDAVDHLSALRDDSEDEVLREAIEEALEAAKYADSQPPDLLRTRIGL